MENVALLETELATYERMRPELLAKHEGAYALVHKDRLVGTFESRRDAINGGYQQLGHVPFLVKQVVEVEVPLTFFSPQLAV